MLGSARTRASAGVAASLATAMALGFAPAATSAPQHYTTVDFAPQLLTVDTPTREAKDRLIALGLDATEHAGHDYIEVVVYSQAELDLLAEHKFTWDVRIPDMFARSAEVNEINRAYAASVETSPLPSGRTEYRSLDDYLTELDELAAAYPDLVKSLEVGTSVEGRPLKAIEIAEDVHVEGDGRPTFLMFGLHHAREWPSGEHTIEFAYDLLTNYGTDARVTDLVGKVRTIILPVSNPDGFDQSYTQGQLIDLNAYARGGSTAVILGTPGNAYKRKNCRTIDGQSGDPASCTSSSPGGYGVGIDLNRNYGALWGGPGTDTNPASPIYRGPSPISEPESQAIQNLMSSRQITTVISNHTFSNLILRPNGVNPQTIAPDGHPIGMAPDEHGMAELGAEMAANNGYANIHGWELYDTTGTTDDYAYNATGAYAYTFEIGPEEFHPPFPKVVDEYVGAGEYEGKGNRLAYLLALENAADTATHAVLEGTAPAGATLTVNRTGQTLTWDNLNNFEDTVETSMTVPQDGTFEWHVNPSTRPFAMSREVRIQQEEPFGGETFQGGPTIPGSEAGQSASIGEHPFTLTEEVAVVEFFLDWETPDDMDLHIFRVEEDGSRTEVGSSGTFLDKEFTVIFDMQPGDYVIEAHNYASVTPTYETGYRLFEADIVQIPGSTESWTLTCEVDGDVVGSTEIVIDRGERQTVAPCGGTDVLAGGQAAPDPAPLPATGGGLALMALLALGGATTLRRLHG